MSAGRMYDRIGDNAKGKIVFVIDGGAVCRVTDKGSDTDIIEYENNIE